MAANDRAESLPGVLQPVTLRLVRTAGPAVVAPTRVLDLETRDGASYVVVACPAGCDPDEHHLEASLSWAHPFGRVSFPVTTHPGRRPYGAVWTLVPTGPATRLQERRHFRASMTVPARLAWPDDTEDPDAEEAEPHRRDAVTVDLSEGGVLALMRGEPPAIGARIDTTLVIDGDELHSPATVVRHVAFPGGGVELEHRWGGTVLDVVHDRSGDR